MKVLEFETANPGQDNVSGDEEVPEERKRAIQESTDTDVGASSSQDQQRPRSDERHRLGSRGNPYQNESRYYRNPSSHVQPRPADYRGPQRSSNQPRYQSHEDRSEHGYPGVFATAPQPSYSDHARNRSNPESRNGTNQPPQEREYYRNKEGIV